MITIENLREFGANVEEGLARCVNKEAFYLKMVNMVLANKGFDALGQKLADKDLDGAFEQAHALKGAVGNVSLTPICEPINAITEKLRAKSFDGCDELYETMMAKRNELLEMQK